MISETGKTFINKAKTQNILKSFMKGVLFNFEEFATNKPLLLKELRKTRLFFNDGDSCYTNGNNIFIGTEFPVLKDPNNSNALTLKLAQGIIIHEIAHIFYTDFTAFSTFVNKSIQNFKKAGSTSKVIFNILEDYRIEETISKDNLFYKRLFFMIRYRVIKNILEKWEEETSGDLSDNTVATNLINSLLIMGFLQKPVFSKNNKLNSLIISSYPVVMKAIRSQSTEDISKLTTYVMNLLEKLDLDKPEDDLSSEAKDLIGNINTRKGSKETMGDGSISKSGAGESNKSNGANGEREVDDITKNLEELDRLSPSTPEELLEELKEIENEIEGETKESDLNNQMIEDYLNGSSNEKKQATTLEKTEKEIKNLSEALPAIHKGLKLNFKKYFDRYHIDDYNLLKNSLNGPIKKLTNKIEELKQYKIEDYEYNMRSGSIDPNSLARFIGLDDIDIFKQQYIEEENINIDVMVLIDCSGSTGSQVLNTKNNTCLARYQVNRMIGIYLHEALKKLEFKHAIWGFDSGNSENISPMVSFENCFTRDSGLNLLDINARSSNRDGYHIRLAGEHLINHSTNNKKLLIVISDGQPAARGYTGKSAMSDVIEAQKELSESGVKTIGIFTGDKTENSYFEDMYENDYYLNNDSIFDFHKLLFELISKEYESELTK